MPSPSPSPQPSGQKPADAGKPVVVVVGDGKAGEYINTLTRGEDSDRRKAAKELKKYKNVSAVVTALAHTLRTDESSDVRREAAYSLGDMAARDAQPALRQAAREDRDSGVRKAALKAAQKIEAAFAGKQ